MPLHIDNAAVTVEGANLVTHLLPHEVYAAWFDCVNDLGPEQVPTNPSVFLTDTANGELVEEGAFLHTTPVSGRVIALGIQNVERGHSYELSIEFDHTPERVAGERSRKIHQVTSP